MKKVLLDASSAILLYKAQLFDKLTTVYKIGITQSVLHELTRKNQYGADTFMQYWRAHKIEVIAIEKVRSSHKIEKQWNSLDLGELDTIKCFVSGGWDFVVTDDGRAAKYCSRRGILFINALLFPRLLYFCHRTSLTECNNKMRIVASHGRYSNHVIEWAGNCQKKALLFAIPDNLE